MTSVSRWVSDSAAQRSVWELCDQQGHVDAAVAPSKAAPGVWFAPSLHEAAVPGGELDIEALVLGLIGYLAAAFTGTALAAAFAQPLVRSPAIAVVGAVGALLLSVGLEIPPTVTVAQAFTRDTPAAAATALIDDDVAVVSGLCRIVCEGV